MYDRESVVIIGYANPSTEGFIIDLEPQYGEALSGLAGFSHAVVLWWAHRVDTIEDRSRLICKKPYTRNPHDVGVFGSRSPSRPNPIGLSVVSIQSIDADRANIVVPYIDAEPGTPVVDVKPYFPASDRVRHVEVPRWCRHWPTCYEDSATFDWAGEFE